MALSLYKKLIFALVLLTCFPFIVKSQQIRPKILKIADEIAEDGVLNGERVGWAGEITDQYLRFVKLKRKATSKELLSLILHENTVVKGYAAWALAEKKYSGLSEVFIRFISSEEMVGARHGCLYTEEALAENLYFHVLRLAFFHPQDKYYLKQAKEFDSIVLHSATQIVSSMDMILAEAIERNVDSVRNYDIIRKVAIEKQYPEAIEALGKYRKREDIDLLISLGEKSFKAVSHFPNPAFWNMLEEYRNKPEKTEDYFEAVAGFCNDNAANLLTNAYNAGLSERKVISLDRALALNYDSVYENLVCRIWLEHKIIDSTLTKRFIKKNPVWASQLFAKGLSNNIKLNFQDFSHRYLWTGHNILPLMLDNIAEYNRGQLENVCRINIMNLDFDDIELVRDVVKKYQLTSVTDAMLYRLKEKSYPFEMYHLSKALFSFNNDEVKGKVIGILKTRTGKWNGSPWEDTFTKLFRENGIAINPE